MCLPRAHTSPSRPPFGTWDPRVPCPRVLKSSPKPAWSSPRALSSEDGLAHGCASPLGLRKGRETALHRDMGCGIELGVGREGAAREEQVEL